MSGTPGGGPPLGAGPSAGATALGGLGGSLEDKDCELLCPVCFELIEEAYVSRCGHSFCFACIAKAVELHRRCPKCGAALPSNDHIFPNFLLNELVAMRRTRLRRPAAEAEAEAGGGVAEGAALRALVGRSARRLALGDVESLLAVLSRRQRALRCESAAAHHRLLLHFLTHLHNARTHQLRNLTRETQLVEKDMEHVLGVLKELSEGAVGGAGAVLGAGGDASALLGDVDDTGEGRSLGAGSEEGFAGGGEAGAGAGGGGLAERWRRLAAHFDDFVQCYFSHRADELYFPGASPSPPAPLDAAPPPPAHPAPPPPLDVTSIDNDQVPDSRPNTAQGIAAERPLSGSAGAGAGEERAETQGAGQGAGQGEGEEGATMRAAQAHTRGLDAFRDDLVAFTRYRALRPLATLSYCSDAINYSTIVSTIEFDKDEELFAIAGVTKRIKVFEWESVVRDAVDVHYPCAEMQCSHKISCVSWNAYHKHVLASSDYEGTVSVWDASTGQRTRALMEHDKRCWSVHFNRADVRLLASGSDDARVKLWSLNAERSVATLEAKFNVCCVRFNPRSSCHLAFGSADHCVHYYDLRAPRRPLQVLRDHRKAVSYVKFLDADTLVSASTDSQLKLWRVDSPRCVRSFTGHANEKNFVGLATDGTYVACGSENNALYVYYAGLSRPLLTYRFDGHRPFLPSGAAIASGAGGGGAGGGAERREEEPSEFVSAVCWRASPHAPALLAANSQGTIKVLELV